MAKTNSNKLIVQTQVIEAQSYKGYAECFEQLAKYFKGKDPLISYIKTSHNAHGHKVLVYMLQDIISPEVRKGDELAAALTLMNL